jgi:hypothetical protein
MRVFDVPQEMADLSEELTMVIMGGEEPSDDLLARLEKFKADGPEAIDAWIFAIKEKEAGIDAIKKREAQLASKKKAMTTSVDYMREALAHVLDTAFAGHFSSVDWTAYTKDCDKQEVEVASLELLPDKFVKTTREPKKAEIKAELKAGNAVPGAALMTTTDHRLTIR